MFFRLPFGHVDVKIDSRNPRGAGTPAPALEILRRVRGERR
jgi:hypothetical protein